MKIYIRSDSNDFDWVNKIYRLMNDWSFSDFPDDFPIAQTKKDVANGDVQKYIDYFNDIIEDQTSYMKNELHLKDETIKSKLKKWQDIVEKFKQYKKG